MNSVAIVIPCFNAGLPLREAINSAKAQTHRDVEVVVVDDGSTDPQTLEILEAVRSEGLRVVVQSNAGPAAARNAGIRETTCRFILPLDADDLIDSSYAEKAADVLERRADIGIVYCKAMKFGSETGPWTLPPYSIREIVVDNVIFVSAMFRRQDWVEVGGFDETLRFGVEDYDFWLKLISRGRGVKQLDEFLFHYRVQTDSRTKKFLKDQAAVVETYARIFRSNQDFFAKHAELMFEHRFGLYREIDDARRRFEKVDAVMDRVPPLRRVARWLYRRL
jgi:glycosyltransferase involved in cell wall biosynthesis